MSFPQYPQHNNNNIINNKRKRMIKMKLVVKKEILLESLNNTARAISTKNLIPILTGIKFELKEDGLYLVKIKLENEEEFVKISEIFHDDTWLD